MPHRLLTQRPRDPSDGCFSKHMSTMNVGGLSPPEPATPEIQGLADQVRGQLEEATNQRFSTYLAILFSKQVVAGMNYFVKVQCGQKEKDYVHLKIFKALPTQGRRVDLSGFQLGKTKNDPIIPF